MWWMTLQRQPSFLWSFSFAGLCTGNKMWLFLFTRICFWIIKWGCRILTLHDTVTSTGGTGQAAQQHDGVRVMPLCYTVSSLWTNCHISADPMQSGYHGDIIYTAGWFSAIIPWEEILIHASVLWTIGLSTNILKLIQRSNGKIIWSTFSIWLWKLIFYYEKKADTFWKTNWKISKNR